MSQRKQNVHGSPKSILVVRLSAVGDCVHCLPALAAMRANFPDAVIGWLVDDRAADLMRGHPYIDRLHVLPVTEWKKKGYGTLRKLRAAFQYAKQLRALDYQVSVDFQGLTKSAFAAFLAGCKKRIGYGDKDGREFSRIFNNILVSPPLEKKHVVDRNNSLLEALGINDVPPDFVFPETSKYKSVLLQFFSNLGWDEETRPVMVFAGETWETKNYPLASLAVVCRELAADGEKVIVGWGLPREKERAEEVAAGAGSGFGGSGGEVVVGPETSLLEFVALVKRLKLFIGGDTGPLHICAGIGVPCVGIYGSTDEKRNGPYGDGHAVVMAEGVSCRPCWKRSCPLRESPPACLVEISPEVVVGAARKLLKSLESS